MCCTWLVVSCALLVFDLVCAAHLFAESDERYSDEQGQADEREESSECGPRRDKDKRDEEKRHDGRRQQVRAARVSCPTTASSALVAQQCQLFLRRPEGCNAPVNMYRTTWAEEVLDVEEVALQGMAST